MLLLFSTTTLTVQLWFVNRMWVISMRKNSAFAGVTALLAVASWGIAVWMFSVLVKHHSSLLDDFHRVFPVGYAWLAGGIVTDLCIFGGLAYYTELRSRRDREHHILSPGSLLAISHRMIECNVLPLFSQICMIILFKLNVGLYYNLHLFIARVPKHSSTNP
ncbi:hypothetical protein GYMLUDRAFT_455571 [Collybiopsis luxurians FD-317 M1]|uniref:Uncharacterized protein n=1 Tax=Collybiopsis luxurians FD-317 M1 TaxID=944289 RepID=A0A0D0BIB0_9AGAR|nr:hypothetical protein GYMLUDRAFT_455571 [Collybiopsis luxurians FD-317 M1]